MSSVTHTARSTTATILGVLGMFFIVSFAVIPLLNLIQAGFLQVLALPGRFLFASFHAAAVFVPLYVLAAAALLRRPSGAAAVLALNLSILPFLTAAVALRLAFDARIAASPVTSSVVSLLGRSQGTVVFLLLTAMLAGLVFVVYRLWRTLDRDSKQAHAADTQNEPDRDRDLPILELPPPAAAFAWRATPRGRARREAEEAAQEAAPSPHSAGLAAGAPGSPWADTDDHGEVGDDLDDDLPPVMYPRNGDGARAGAGDTTGHGDGARAGDPNGLQIAWPNGRNRVTFDDLEMLEPVEEDEFEAQSAEERELVVEFRDGHFRSIDGDTEISVGFNPSPRAHDHKETREEQSRQAAGTGSSPEREDGAAGHVFGDVDFDDESFDEDDEDMDFEASELASEAWGLEESEYDDDEELSEEWEPDDEYYGTSEDDDSGAALYEQALSDPEQAPTREYNEMSEGEASSTPGTTSARPVSSSRTPRTPQRGRTRGKVSRYHVPVEGLLQEYPNERYWELDERTKSDSETLRYTLQEFGIEAEVTGIRKGPVITMFEILPAPGVKLTKIVNLADNIALRLAAQTVRIVAPIPGKHAVGIEVPNKRRAIVSFADLVQQSSFRDKEHSIPLAIGKDIPGDAQIIDLAKTPHLLIAGATGSGKSVCVNSIICSILYRRAPQDVKMILIDPKIVELKFYNDIPHLLTPVITEPKRAFQALQWALYEMERRYSLLDSLQVRDIASYNRKVKAKKLAVETLPYLVIVVDEFADLMATSGKELESTLARLAAMSRAVGIHLVLATQRPSTDVITGLIKANIPSRIAFMVASKVDSRIILDTQGAEKLLGRGDMLFTSAWDPAPIRMQGAFLSEDEVERVVTHVKSLGAPDYIDDEIFIDEDEDSDPQEDLEDPLLEKAITVVQQSRKASASYLQRRLKIGYNRAARMVEEMERYGIVGPANGSKPREILRGEAVGVGE
ncbi:MAG: DNA translocase FtsK [Spirochaetia bacterium]